LPEPNAQSIVAQSRAGFTPNAIFLPFIDMAKILRWKRIAAGQPFHLAATSFSQARPAPLHAHDFFELFLVDSGSGQHRLRDGLQELKTGDLALIRPGDAHAFKPGHGGLSIINLAFPRQVLGHLRRRYFPADKNLFGLRSGEPELRRLDPPQRLRFKLLFQAMASEPPSLAALEHFLLGLFLRSRRGDEGLDLSCCPPWLRRACRGIGDPAQFSKGTRAFAALAGRSPEHVARELKRHLGLTPTDLLNRARLKHAAAQLSLGESEITEIALDCGFESLTHFYRLFSRQFHMSPGKYRRLHRVPLN
jgi:AraC family cel operon transcriptional repressor